MSEQRKYQNVAATSFVTAEEMPLASSYEERPLRIPTFSADVFGVVVLVFLFTTLAAWAAFDSWRVGVAIGGVAAVLAVLWRTSQVYDKPLSHVREKTFQEVQAEVDEATRYADRSKRGVEAEPIAITRRSKTVEFATNTFTFTGKMLDTLLIWYEGGNRQLRRDSGAAGPGLREIGIGSNDYPAVIELLRGRGLLDAGNCWTAAGENWLKAE